MNKIFNHIIYLFSKLIKKSNLASIINSKIDITSKVEARSCVVSTVMGKYSFCGYDCDVFCADIGNFTSIASGVVLGGARHPMEWVGMSPVFYKGRDSVKKKFSEFELPKDPRVIIGSDVWIGRNAIILSGVRVGHGAVIGAGAVVTKDIPPFAVAVGNPARIKKYRFSDAIIERLLHIAWWDLDDGEIESRSHFINNPSLFIDSFSEKLK